jgi:hypothetical protein
LSILIVLGKECNSKTPVWYTIVRSSALSSSLQPPTTLYNFRQNILLSTLFANTLSSSLNVGDQGSHSHERQKTQSETSTFITDYIFLYLLRWLCTDFVSQVAQGDYFITRLQISSLRLILHARLLPPSCPNSLIIQRGITNLVSHFGLHVWLGTPLDSEQTGWHDFRFVSNQDQE